MPRSGSRSIDLLIPRRLRVVCRFFYPVVLLRCGLLDLLVGEASSFADDCEACDYYVARLIGW